jgi:hypothetical protein
MLDQMLEAAYEEDQKDKARQQMAEAFMSFPEEELHKIASGEVKLADFGSDEDWLEKFQGTPMYDQALALEEQKLKLDIAQQQSRRQERAGRDQLWDARDAICLQKRMLELQLRKQQGGGGDEALGDEAPGEEPVAEPPPGPSDAPTEAPPEEEKTSAVDYFYGRRLAELDKLAAVLREKRAFSDAKVLRAREQAALKELALLQDEGVAAYRDDAGKTQRGSIRKALGTPMSTDAVIEGPRHLAYAAKKHEEGKNAWNPWGGMLTPHPAEGAGATSGLMSVQGKIDPSKLASVNVSDVWGREMAKQAMIKVACSALEKVACDQVDELDELELHAIDEMAKAAEARLEAGVELGDLLDFEKTAIWGAVKAGLKGAGRFLGAAGKGVGQAAKAGHAAGGLKGAATAAGGALKRVGQLGGGMAKQFVQKNPLAGAAIAGGAGLAGGAMLGRASKRGGNQTNVTVQR